MKYSFSYLLLIIIEISCSNPNNKISQTTPIKNGSQLTEMQIDHSDQSFGGDITLHIYNLEVKSTEVTVFKILSQYKGRPIGFRLRLKKPIKRTEFVTNGVTLLSLGDTSNNFLSALAEVYQSKAKNLVFVDSITINYADLESIVDTKSPGNYTAAQTKLFFTTRDDQPELYMNIEIKNKTISFPEKDNSYREGILEALSKPKR